MHQLRVGTRRAGAALNIFSLCLPDKVYASSRKQLRRLRRAAGEARDWDVFLLALAEQAPQKWTRQRAALDFLIGYALANRVAAQDHLVAASDDSPLAFERLVAETIAAVQPPADGPPTLIDLARPVLFELLQKLELAAAQDLNDYDHLHQVRIRGKRLRYAMEIFADCFAPAFQNELYPAVEEMQEILGRANDSHVACRRLEVLRGKLKATLSEEWQRVKPGIEKLFRFHEVRLPQERQRFLEWWTRWQQAGGEAAFTSLLKSAEPRAAS